MKIIRTLLLLIYQVLWMNANLMKSSKSVSTHDIFYPIVSFHNVKISEKKERMKRAENNKLSTVLREKMNVKFQALGKNFDFDLDLNDKLLAPNFQIETLNRDGRVKQRHTVENCFYNGRINKRNDTLVSLSNCNGLSGIIQYGREHYYIRPAKHDEYKKREDIFMKKRAHVIRRTRESFDHTHEATRYARFVSDKGESDCGLDDVKPHVRWVRNTHSSKEGEQTIETMVTIDQKMAQFYGMDASKQYALTIANAAHNILRDSTIGPNTVNLIITKLIVLTSPLNDLSINHHARNSLASFGRWADRRNNLNNEHPEHYDYAVLLTKHDICVDSNQPCETKGLSYVSGMCDGSKSAAIIEDDGFGAAFTLAHQTGHSLGMDHDNVGNSCADTKRIMSSYGAKTADAFHWSTCSADYLQQFLRKEQSKCLMDSPARSKRESIKAFNNPGRLSGALIQCQMIFGADSQACVRHNTEQICNELTCLHPIWKNCSSVGIPSLDGTFCGNKKWCKQGACVYRDNQRNDNMVDGGWTSWLPYQPCTKQCGGGITYRERFCENPKPKNGGEYCEGESRSYSICNKMPCVPLVNDRKLQCEKLGASYYGDKVLNWTFNGQDQDHGCDLNCNPVVTDKVKKYFGHVTDGTDCIISNMNGKCIQGECNVVGCDMVLGSTETFDRCGVCKGDGSTCPTNLQTNPLVLAERNNNQEIMKRIYNLENQKNATVMKVANKLMRLREVLHMFALKQCDGELSCIQNRQRNIAKKTEVSNEPIKFHWEIKSQGCTVSCGRGVETLKAQCLRVDDETPVGDIYCNTKTRPNGVTRVCQRSPCQASWTVSKWTSCSKSCGGGTKTRNIYCTVNDGVTEYNLPKSQCNVHNKPAPIGSCNLEECPIEWYAEPYGQCSTTCGRGIRSRSIRCRVINKVGVETVFPNDQCSNLIMPVTEMLCNVHNPCPGDGECGGIWNDPSGIITSPNYPSNYNDNMECVHEIQTSGKKVITLNFTDVAIGNQFNSEQCTGDFLRITDGKCSDQLRRPSTLICGDRIPGIFISKDNVLCLKFVSDQSGNDKGFSLIYNISDTDDNQAKVRDICDITGMTMNTSVGVVTSPNYPKNYPPNEECMMTLNALDSTGFMIKFDAFQVGTRSGVMKCKTDYLEFIYDGKSEEICGSETTIPTIHIPSPQLTIKFHSSPIKMLRKGFVLTYVTKEYARNYAKTKQAIRKIDEYSTTLKEWRNRQLNLNYTNNQDTNIPTVSKATTIRKNTIGRYDNMINNRRQLIEVLMKLANDDSSTRSNINTKTTARSNVPTKPFMVKKLPSHMTNNVPMATKPFSHYDIQALNPRQGNINSYYQASNKTTLIKSSIKTPQLNNNDVIMQKNNDVMQRNSTNTPQHHTSVILTNRTNPASFKNSTSTIYPETNEGVGVRIHKTDIPRPTVNNERSNIPLTAMFNTYPSPNNVPYTGNIFGPATPLQSVSSINPFYRSYIPQASDNTIPISQMSGNTIPTTRNYIQQASGNTIPTQQASGNTIPTTRNYIQQASGNTIPTTRNYIQQASGNTIPTTWWTNPINQQLRNYIQPMVYKQPTMGQFIPNTQTMGNVPTLTMYRNMNQQPLNQLSTVTQQYVNRECSRTTPVRCMEAMFRDTCSPQIACRDVLAVCCMTDCFPMKFVCIPNG